MEPVVLTDGVVRLAPPGPAEIDRVAELVQDPEVQRWTRVPSPYRREDAAWFVGQVVGEGWAAGRELTWGVRDARDGRLAGMIGIQLHETRRAAEVGYWMGAADRGRGWTTRALGLVAGHAFSELGLDHLTWSALVGNFGSRRVAWRTGFRVEGTARRWVDQRGAWRDSWIGTLLSDDPRVPATSWLAPVRLAGRLPGGTPLVLRRWRQDDVDAVVEACTDGVTRHWLAELPAPYTPDVARSWIEGQELAHAEGAAVHWAASLGDDEPAVGSFSLLGGPGRLLVGGRLGGGEAEVGYWVHPRARGCGVATTAVTVLVAHSGAPVAAGGLGLRRLSLAHAAGNTASAAVARSCGFVPWGREPDAERLGDGSRTDRIWLARPVGGPVAPRPPGARPGV